ncbi:ATP-dependent zinc protease family protein [Pararhodonellum marinum]|uniref:ATP-dependent zinc protease family protein n=1 Tax=Pararhodonellum marinum TaxID=2755358 RepID=UPI00188EE268|nr:RimK/LysX family protein [Pararhodonellum marinum]
MEKHVIGRREKISIKPWGLRLVSAKVDTGAYTSAIHCEEVVEKETNGEKILEFKVLPKTHRLFKDEWIRTKDYSQKKVKNSFGQTELRYKVSTKVTMFGEEFEAEFTLTDRSKMRNAILIGRKLLKERFLVDVDQVNLSRKHKPTPK